MNDRIHPEVTLSTPLRGPLAVVGATGSLGQVLVQRALARGHQVRAVARRPERLPFEAPGLELHAADLMGEGELAPALQGARAVIVALGAGLRDSTPIRARGTARVVEAMHEAGVRRLVCLSILGLGDSYAGLPWVYKAFVKPLILRRPYQDHAAQEEVVEASGLDWTLVRPPNFTDGPARGQYRHGFGEDLAGSTLKISRADLADFMLDQVEDDRYLHARPGITD